MVAICEKIGTYEVLNKSSVLLLLRLKFFHRLVEIEDNERWHF